MNDLCVRSQRYDISSWGDCFDQLVEQTVAGMRRFRLEFHCRPGVVRSKWSQWQEVHSR